MTLSERLRTAREARGWSIDDVGAKLRLPARVVARVEAGDFEGLGAPVYQRGYLRSFARLVEVPDAEVDAALRTAVVAEPELVATGVMARSEYVAERYLRPASYIALTALIALPVVWWAASGRLGQELAGRGSFDLQQPPLERVAVSAPEVELERPGPPPLDIGPQRQEMLRASIMSVPRPGDVTTVPSDHRDAVAPPLAQPAGGEGEGSADGQEAAGSNVIGTGAHEAVLDLTSNSWVEVTSADGRRVHQALLAPGQWRFRADAPLSLLIGNSRNAKLTVNGAEIDLATHRSSSDVARLDVFAADANG